jgi:tRNA threonylcarbamoyladenosine biosynthesis protein TsaE
MSRISITSLADIDQAAAAFLEVSQGYQVMAFSGEMGAGKTTFIQAISRCLGITAEVNSPTFSLVNEYFTPEGDSVYHFDLYRIEDPAELFDMGYEEYFYSGSLCLIEWPEKASHLVPDDALRVKIQVMDDRSRELQF